jgi:hypothetical protein
MYDTERRINPMSAEENKSLIRWFFDVANQGQGVFRAIARIIIWGKSLVLTMRCVPLVMYSIAGKDASRAYAT